MNKTYRVITDQFVTTEEVVIALRSKQYKQGKQDLYDPTNNCYCVMGVIAKLVGFNEADIKTRCYLSGLFESFVEGYYAYADENLRCITSFEGVLIRYNDNDNLSFNQIADKLENKDDPIKDLTIKIPKVELINV